MIDINIPPIILVGGSGGSAGWYVFWGAVAGGLASVIAQIVSAVTQHFTQKRRDADKLAQERAVRWDDRIRDVSARFIGATYQAIQTDNSVDEILKAINSRYLFGNADDLNPFNPETVRRESEREIAIQEAREPVRRTQAEASALLAELLMIAPEQVRTAALELWSMSLKRANASPEARPEAKRNYEMARSDLIRTVAAVLRPELPTKKSAADAGSSSTEQGS